MDIISSFEQLSSHEKTELQKWMVLGTFGTTQQKEEARVWFTQHYTVTADGALRRKVPRGNYVGQGKEQRIQPSLGQ